MVNGKKPKGVGVGSSTGIVRKVDECPIPNGCKDKDPQEYKKWGAHKLPIKRYSDLNEIIDILIHSEVYQLTLHTEKRKDLSKKIPSLKNYEVDELQIFHSAEKAKKTRAEKEQKSSQTLEMDAWRYTQWEYVKELDTQKFTDEEKEEYERKYWHTEEITDTWTGDGNRTIWSTSTTPINEGERVYVKGKLMRGETDYTIDRAKGKIEFTQPPPELAEIRAHYLVTKVKPGHPTRGASLKKSHGFVRQDIGDGNRNVTTFTVSVVPIQKDSERVYVKGELMRRGIDYTIDPAKGEVTFTNPPRAQDIVVIYSDTFQAYKIVEEKDFEMSRREALDRLKWFSDVVKNANSERYEATFKGKTDPKQIKDWIEKWDVPFPSRVLKDDTALRHVEFNLRCKKCNKTWIRIPWHPPSIEGAAECPNHCKAPFEVMNFNNIYEIEDTIAILEMDEQIENQIKNEIEKTCDVEPLAIFFKVDEPKPGNPTSETEQQVLSDPPKKLEEVANNLAQQLHKIKNEGANAKVTFWGYADTSAGCPYNEDLSFRRAEWVKDKMESKLKTKNIELPAINLQVGCGRGLADRRKKSGGYIADAHRAVIIELDNL